MNTNTNDGWDWDNDREIEIELADYLRWYGWTPNYETFDYLTEDDQSEILAVYEREQAAAWAALDPETRARIEEFDRIEAAAFWRGY